MHIIERCINKIDCFDQENSYHGQRVNGSIFNLMKSSVIVVWCIIKSRKFHDFSLKKNVAIKPKLCSTYHHTENAINLPQANDFKTIIKYMRRLLFLILRKKQIKKKKKLRRKKQFSFQNNFVMRPSKFVTHHKFVLHEVDKTFFSCLVYTQSCTNFILLLLKHISSNFF